MRRFKIQHIIIVGLLMTVGCNTRSQLDRMYDKQGIVNIRQPLRSEKKEQVDFLAKNGCDMIQGFYFAKPMPIGDFEKKHWSEIPEPVTQA